MRVWITGIDGYEGWPLAVFLAKHGHTVAGNDYGLRRMWVAEVGGMSVTPIASLDARSEAAKELGFEIEVSTFDLTTYPRLRAEAIGRFAPDAIIHLAAQPSAPYAMKDVGHATYTWQNNTQATLNLLWIMRDVCPDAHLVWASTMGEYGTPPVLIPEAHSEVFPRLPGSFYHSTKVADNHNIAMACRFWGLRATALMQGVVYGTEMPVGGYDPRLVTRFDVDESFGTALHRFCAQAVLGEPMTVYGKGHQQRGFVSLHSMVIGIHKAMLMTPGSGELRTANQIDGTYSILELAELAAERAQHLLGAEPKIASVANPRVEAEEHVYNPDTTYLRSIGCKPPRSLEDEVDAILVTLDRYRDRLEQVRAAVHPKTLWR